MCIPFIFSNLYSVCINGDIYCHELSEDDCTTIPEPLTAGVSCTYGDRNINPGELTLVQPEDEDCEIWSVSLQTSLGSFFLFSFSQ